MKIIPLLSFFLASTCFFTFSQKAQSTKTKEADFKTFAIGSQKWMAENLNTERFLNGEKIQEVKTLEEWKVAINEKRPAWCYYNFDTTNSKAYGKLYNWYAVNDPRGLAPEGWKIPSLEDWQTLEKSVNSKYPYSTSTELLLMSTSNWKSNITGMGISGFNAQPSGYIESKFKELGEIAYFWTNKIDDIIFLRDDSYYQFQSTESFDDYLSFIGGIDFKKLQSGSSHDGFEGDGFAVRCVKNETFPIIGEGKVQLKNKYFDGMSSIDSLPVSYLSRDVTNLSKNDTTYFFNNDFSIHPNVKPFYISDHEVTNGEYREFVNWVRDSIAREKIVRRCSEEDQKKWIKNVTFNSGKKDKKGNYFTLNWSKKLDYEDPEVNFLISDMYYTESERFYYKRKEIDVRLLFFDYYDEDGTKNRIHVYPDNSLWEKEMHMDNSTQENYFWAEYYKNFPIVGLTFEQAKAYCIWRTMMYHYEAGKTSKKNYDPTLKFRLPNEKEWERAAMNYVIINEYKWNRLLPITNGYQINSNGNYQANFGPIQLNSGLYIKSFQDDGISYLCKVKSYEPNFNGLYCMYGNAAEWVNTTPELGNFYNDYLRYFQRNDFFKRNDTSKKVVYITDPYTDSTFLVEKDSEQHKNLIQKRLDFYHVSAEDTFEEVKKKFLALNSIDESYKSKIYELNNPKKSIAKDSVKSEKGPKDVIDGVDLLEEIPSRRNNYIKIYNISSGEYDFIETKEPYDFFTWKLYPAFTRYKQNASALKRAENPFSYPSSNLKNNYRLVKGGSWHDEAHYLVLKNSQVYNKDEASCRIGFRIAADAIGNEMNKYDKKRIKKQRELRKQNEY
ncbi:MAG: FISUMP domain-containing protein [Bacteroidota bacterium]